MAKAVFKLLHKSRFREYIRPVVEDGASCFTFIALIDTLEDDSCIPCYVKAYPNIEVVRKDRRIAHEMSVFNECIGYLLAQESDYKVPPHAGLISVDSTRIPDRPHWMHGQWTCFFSSAIDYPSLNAAYIGIPTDNLPAMVAGLDGVAAVIAFDDVTGNIDRNIGNLIIGNDGSLYLIDHGRIFGAAWHSWLPEDLIATVGDRTENILERVLLNKTNAYEDPEFRRRIFVAHEDIEKLLIKKHGLSEVRKTLLDRQVLPLNFVSAVCHFISHRSNLSGASKKLSVLHLEP